MSTASAPGFRPRRGDRSASNRILLAMAYKATHRFARISARKVRPIADLIRGKPVQQALSILQFMPHRGARLLEKVLRSAMGNAEELRAPGVQRMFVVDARVDGGPMFKRIRPRARGMAYLIRKRMSHIHVAIDARSAPAARPQPAARRRAAATPRTQG
jgi:large subunit ribosomal protein L22